MTQITVPSAGDPIITTWGQSVANRLNLEEPLAVPADESTNSSSASPSNVTGMTFDVVNGTSYRVTGQVWYSCSATNQGIAFGFRHPGGSAIGLFRVTGVTAAAVEAIERLIELSASTDELTTAATVGTGSSVYVVEFSVYYKSTADGTFAFRKARNGTSGSTGLTILKGSGGIVHITT